MDIQDYFFPKNPVTQQRELHLIPLWLENLVGESHYAPLLIKSGGEVGNDPTFTHLVTVVQNVGRRLSQHSPRQELKYEFKVIRNREDNAWCLPGGKIGINSALVQHLYKDIKDEDLVAAVLSHEMIHAAARHTGRALELRLFLVGLVTLVQAAVKRYFWDSIDEGNARLRNDPVALDRARKEKYERIDSLFNPLSSLLIGSLTLCNSRSHELESDRYGMQLMKKAGYDPAAAVTLQKYFKDHTPQRNWAVLNFLSTHPTPDERIAANENTLVELQKGTFH